MQAGVQAWHSLQDVRDPSSLPTHMPCPLKGYGSQWECHKNRKEGAPVWSADTFKRMSSNRVKLSSKIAFWNSAFPSNQSFAII